MTRNFSVPSGTAGTIIMLLLLSAFVVCDRSFKIVGDEFQMDGQPFRYISGSFHYFRQHPDDWETTIQKMATGGLNAIQTYIPWNLHEPSPGCYNFDGSADIVRFLTLCQKYNMYVLLRPGPFICAEWDFGGFPYWLLRELEPFQFRRNDQTYLNFVDGWFSVLFPKLAPFMYHNGGPVIMVQVENEYGLYAACDLDYLRHLALVTRAALGEETVLFTTDPAEIGIDLCSTVTDLMYATCDFGTGGEISVHFQIQRDWNRHGPSVNSEFYTGWLDHWGEPHHTVDTAAVVRDLDTMLSLNASVNMYMYFGGSNFGFWAGSNGDKNSFSADPTSYDYDAPLSEAADLTYKWGAIRDVIQKYRPNIPSYDVANSTKKNYGSVGFGQSVALWNADAIVNVRAQNEKPLSFEKLDLAFGFVRYHTQTKGGILNLETVHDIAYVYENLAFVRIVERNENIAVSLNGGDLDVLVASYGRINYGDWFVEEKGLVEGVTLNGESLGGWEHSGFNLSRVSELEWSDVIETGKPAFYRAVFNVAGVADTFFNPKGLSKGVVIVNGFNLGRYWTEGPQLTLYVPGHVLKEGENELIVFEQEGVAEVPVVSFDDTPQIGII
jgi:beta-galactosidase